MNLFENITTILFDLDNTLLIMNEKEFVISYASNLAKYFADIFDNAGEFINHLLQGTNFMISTKSKETNIEKFFNYFMPLCKNFPKDEIYSRFLNFYTNEFDMVKYITKPDPFTKKVISNVSKKFDIVIATNPIFPEIATKKRILWAGLGDYYSKFMLITHGDYFMTSKPSIEYYEEILNTINKTPEECLMVGNDLYNDGAASILGIKYYQISNGLDKGGIELLNKDLADQVDWKKIKISGEGTLEEFNDLVIEFLQK
jgi:FMN phosphatase YigB (HAD superfamily)